MEMLHISCAIEPLGVLYRNDMTGILKVGLITVLGFLRFDCQEA